MALTKMELGECLRPPYVALGGNRTSRPEGQSREEPRMLATLEYAKFTIRKATREDAAAIVACLRSAFEDYREAYTPAAFVDTVLTPDTLEQRLAHMRVLVAVDAANQVIGTIACQVVSREEGHVRGMAVLPRWQGAGVAAELLRAAETELRKNKCAHVTLDTTAPLMRAMGFYEKNGYARSGKITHFFGMPLYEYRKSLKGADL
jgi:predicted N-acetyltransferase YhbS